jgi:hypothetical protein
MKYLLPSINSNLEKKRATEKRKVSLQTINAYINLFKSLSDTKLLHVIRGPVSAHWPGHRQNCKNDSLAKNHTKTLKQKYVDKNSIFKKMGGSLKFAHV